MWYSWKAELEVPRDCWAPCGAREGGRPISWWRRAIGDFFGLCYRFHRLCSAIIIVLQRCYRLWRYRQNVAVPWDVPLTWHFLVERQILAINFLPLLTHLRSFWQDLLLQELLELIQKLPISCVLFVTLDRFLLWLLDDHRNRLGWLFWRASKVSTVSGSCLENFWGGNYVSRLISRLLSHLKKADFSVHLLPDVWQVCAFKDRRKIIWLVPDRYFG